MKFVADEGVDRQIVQQLRFDNHEILYVLEFAPGSSDEVVLDLARQENIPLITADKDFGELVFRLKLVTSGVVLIRLEGLSPSQKGIVVSQAIQEHGHEVSSNFSVITPYSIRIRKLEE
ncbi:MAG: DUF5615 family PIN-like protein [Leptolyngbyaceae bacterium]|nr:DUF5615 family PIN-like protein [Leptolyngbyaceae bacterium]